MGLASLFLFLALLFGSDVKSATGREYYSVLTVDNGQSWGSWGSQAFCPAGSYATGFSLKVEYYQEGGDDTAVNGIRLHCTQPGRDDSTRVESTSGTWGEWTRTQFCPFGSLKSFQLNVEPQHDGDNTAVNNIRFKCSGITMLEGYGMDFGDWGRWSSECSYGGICGIQTRVEPYQWNIDNTGLNDVQFFCCK
ncbi:vitelline membrane outer layer protein 1 [Chanos chanos]|uniref:Vitelline membrane outer layer protein 1 n=1 Tax=Chanos chanos TaxID=29144 RepID=A0A6J2WMP5_CHACN|nr:vitelline membrane outer layer protein 1-like [Chanos chanos]